MPQILKFPDATLTRISDPVTEFDEVFRKQVEDLYTAILECPPGTCAGMAAPQIGISKRFFFAQGKLFVNPVVTLSNGQKLCKEGCFSAPGGFTQLFKLWRRATVWIEYQDMDGKKHKERYNGWMAEVIQHEYDHLQGVCCYDRQKAVYGSTDPIN